MLGKPIDQMIRVVLCLSIFGLIVFLFALLLLGTFLIWNSLFKNSRLHRILIVSMVAISVMLMGTTNIFLRLV